MATPQAVTQNLFPPLDDAAYAALRDDIAERGVLVPVEVDKDTGEILDGHHRLRAAQELNIDAPTIERRFDSQQDRWAHIIALNLKRRHMDPATWGEMFIRLCKEKGVRLGPGRQRGKKAAAAAAFSPSAAAVAESLGVAARTARERVQAARLPAATKERVRTGEQTATAAIQEQARKQRNHKIQPQRTEPPVPPSVAMAEAKRAEEQFASGGDWDVERLLAAIEVLATEPPPDAFISALTDVQRRRLFSLMHERALKAGVRWLRAVTDALKR